MKPILFSIFASIFACTPLAAYADEQAAHAETISGVVQQIDYTSGTINLLAANGRSYVITASPSTSIVVRSKSTYEDLSDIRPGAHLLVEASRVNRKLDAELITIGDAR